MANHTRKTKVISIHSHQIPSNCVSGIKIHNGCVSNKCFGFTIKRRVSIKKMVQTVRLSSLSKMLLFL